MRHQVWQRRNRAAARSLLLGFAFSAAAALPAPAAEAKNEAKGTLSYKTENVTLLHAYLVRGPDAIDPKKIIRRLILTSADLAEKLLACKEMSCTDGEVREGMTVDIGAGPRLNFWVAVRDQHVQYSGTQKPEALAARIDDDKRLAGRLVIDSGPAGSPRVDVEFDAALVKEFRE